MRSISIKAFVISNIACVAILALLAGALGFVGLFLEFDFLRYASAQGAEPTMRAAAAAFTSSAAPAAIVMVSISAAYLGAGYVAGLLAASARPLNGALSATFFILCSIYTTFFGAPTELFGMHLQHHEHGQLPEVISEIFSWGGPIFGLAGGYLAERIDGRTAGRWILAFPASIATYWLLLILAVSLHSPKLLMFAAAAAILSASAIVPARHRLAAYVTFSVLVIATAVGLELWRDAATSASFSSPIVIYNCTGAVLALIFGRRMLTRLEQSRHRLNPSATQ